MFAAEKSATTFGDPPDCSRRRSKKTSKLRVTGLCEGNSPVTGDFPAQMAGYAENVSIWWRHHERPLPSTRKHLKMRNLSVGTIENEFNIKIVKQLAADFCVPYIVSVYSHQLCQQPA